MKYGGPVDSISSVVPKFVTEIGVLSRNLTAYVNHISKPTVQTSNLSCLTTSGAGNRLLNCIQHLQAISWPCLVHVLRYSECLCLLR